MNSDQIAAVLSELTAAALAAQASAAHLALARDAVRRIQAVNADGNRENDGWVNALKLAALKARDVSAFARAILEGFERECAKHGDVAASRAMVERAIAKNGPDQVVNALLETTKVKTRHRRRQ
ncbi:MAG TPA: hypothetical protein VF041_01220 [Gemmatimonadaceae bacterium]